ncbi:GNAT family N-acetyltransferase [Paenibacillus sepulcri]|uniref:GNAT family N-acetyltransferase n=1 Tax=Paenibacillus sepulcri TaxID=359917 RepID=A0ABS7C9F8_9BACL|nr:GNAT family N-acetyltransferase [Paenibacillus sepulcri]
MGDAGAVILETERLVLRCYQDEDLPALHDIFAEPGMMSFYPAPFTRSQTRSWIERNQTRYLKDGYGLWAVCLKETNACIGDCGLVAQQIDGRPEVEIGYHIKRGLWSQGYATEAALACRDYGFGHLGLPRLISIIHPRNTASIRVAEKLGFVWQKDVYIFNNQHSIYSAARERTTHPCIVEVEH